MPTELILRQYVEHLGNRGEIVKVADGYARNFLLPRKMALRVTSENKKQIERERAKAEAHENDERAAAQSLADVLATADISIARRVGEHNALYGSVTTSDIAEALSARQITIDRRKIVLDEPLKTIGEHVLTIKLHRDVPATVTIKIVAAQAAG
jgi:large subunit ribosomal protein L9